MKNIKSVLLVLTLLFSQYFIAQDAEQLRLYRKDFKAISGKNTVTITSYKKGDSNFVYVGGFGGIDVYGIDKTGSLTKISAHQLYKEKGPARGMVVDNIEGTDYLFVANKFGNVIETHKVLKNGSLKRVSYVEDTEETHLAVGITLQIVHMKDTSYLFVGGLERTTPGLSCFRIHKDGKLTHVQSIKDTEEIHTDGIIGMYVHKIKEKTYLYTGGFQDNGVSGFQVFDDGTFKHVNSIHDNTTDRYLTGAYPVTGVQFGDQYYIVVGHRHHKYYTRKGFIKKTDFVYHGDAVSVFKIDESGALIPHSVLKDDESTKLMGQTRIEVISVNSKEAILAVGTRDDAAIQLLKLSVDGNLVPLHYLETGFSIYYGLNALTIGEDKFLLAGSQRFDMGKVVSYKVEPEKVNHDRELLKHVVILDYKESATPEQIEEAETKFDNLKNEIPEILNLEWGVNDSTEGHSKGFTHTFTLTFSNEHSREIYLFHKEHQALVKKIGPLLEDVLVMDYWVKK